MNQEALKLALEAMKSFQNGTNGLYEGEFEEEIKACEEALAQPEQEPDGYVQKVIDALYENSDPVSVEAAELLEHMAQPEQEPVAWINWCAATGERSVSFECESELASQPLYSGVTQITQDRYSNDIQQRKPLTHEQRFDLLTKFEPHKNKWEAPAILIDMVEAAHSIKE